jgi:hypothetical protein
MGFVLGNFAIGFFDIQGQGDKLKSLARLPDTPEELEATEKILNATAGTVLALRRGFNTYFLQVAQPTGLLERLPNEQRELAGRLRSLDVTYRGFSDSFIVQVPITNDLDHVVSMNGIQALMFGGCGMFAAALAAGVPIRGGIDVGPGLDLGEDEVYGPTLVRAYELESRVACYPRILVGDAMYDYLKLISSRSGSGVEIRAARTAADQCLAMVIEAPDSKRMLDVIGPAFRNIALDLPSDPIESGYRWAVSEEARFSSLGNSDLASRYGKLRAYLESNLQLWGIKTNP